MSLRIHACLACSTRFRRCSVMGTTYSYVPVKRDCNNPSGILEVFRVDGTIGILADEVLPRNRTGLMCLHLVKPCGLDLRRRVQAAHGSFCRLRVTAARRSSE